MPAVKVYNLAGIETGTVNLDDRLFSQTAKPELIYQAVRVLEARQRKVLAHTKNRSEVRGGGKKPWRQKGTGRARAGSIRSPLWRGGGITFGPRKERNFKLSIPRQMVKKVLRAVLAERVRGGHFFVSENLSWEKPATRELAAFLSKLKLNTGSTLLLAGAGEETARLSARNLPRLASLRLENLNILDLLAHKNIVLSRETLAQLTKQLA